jgi:hypothetical protein
LAKIKKRGHLEDLGVDGTMEKIKKRGHLEDLGVDGKIVPNPRSIRMFHL